MATSFGAPERSEDRLITVGFAIGAWPAQVRTTPASVDIASRSSARFLRRKGECGNPWHGQAHRALEKRCGHVLVNEAMDADISVPGAPIDRKVASDELECP